MARSFVYLTAIVALALAPALAFAGTDSPRVTTTRKGGSVTIAARTPELVVSQTLRRGLLDVSITAGADRVRVVGDEGGFVRVERAGRTRSFDVRAARAEDITAVRAMLSTSTAMSAFESLLASPWGGSRAAMPFAASHALVALLQARTEPLRAIVQRARAGDTLLKNIRLTSGECWHYYERDAVRYTYELEQCVADASNSLNPLRVSWCAYSYNLKTTLAFLWLLDCNGY
jgi:hypothetical protein